MPFERPPFENCPFCGNENTFGILNIHDNYYTKRCKKCRESMSLPLPKLNKRVIYLDQFALSNMMKASTNSFRANVPEEDKTFWTDLDKQVKKIVLLQAAIFPDSLLHMNESLLSPFYEQLRSVYEGISGETSFLDHMTINQSQLAEFAVAWIEGKGPPTLDLTVDKILHGERNAWLPAIRISVNRNFNEEHIEKIREERIKIQEEFAGIFKQWREDGPKDFKNYVRIENEAYGKLYMSGIQNNLTKMQMAHLGLGEFSIDIVLNESNIIFTILSEIFRKRDISDEKMIEKVAEFFRWDGLHQIPTNKIKSYLFAAIARKAASGQITPPNLGMLSDMDMISTYMPYCDAIFIDNGCAALLRERPLCDDLNYGTKIFSTNTRDDFMNYLSELENSLPDKVKQMSDTLYNKF